MYTYKILTCENYDGDTLNLTLDLGFGLVHHVQVRLDGVDTPELRGGTPTSRAAGMLAKKYVADFIVNAQRDGDAFFVSTNYKGKFGRTLGDVVDKNSNSLCKILLDNHMAVKYDGRNKSELVDDHHANAIILEQEGRLQNV